MALWRRFVRSRSAVLGLGVLTVVVIAAATAPIAFPGSPFRRVDQPFLPPFGSYLFGTDVLGRDVAAGIAHGARTSRPSRCSAWTAAAPQLTALDQSP